MDAPLAWVSAGWELPLHYLASTVRVGGWVLAAALALALMGFLEAYLGPPSSRWRGLRTGIALAWPLVPLALAALAVALVLGAGLAWTTTALLARFAGKTGGSWPLVLAAGLLFGLFALLARGLNARHLRLALMVGVVSVGGAALPAIHLAGDSAALVVLKLAVVAVAAAWGYRLLKGLNARYSPRSLHISEVVGEDGTRRQDLERLLEEGFYKSSLHSPSPVPGGEPLYWTHFKEDVQRLAAEADAGTRLGAVVKSLGTFLRIASVPHRLEVQGAVIRSPPDAKRCGVRLRAVDGHTGELVLADTFWGKSVHAAVELASYAIVASAFYRCRYLPGWVLWEGRDGEAVRSYWRGCEALKRYRGGGAESALECFAKSFAQSPGTAYPGFQLAGLYELMGIRAAVGWDPVLREGNPARRDEPRARDQLLHAIELYCDLLTKHPHLLLGWFRLSAVLANASHWWTGSPEERDAAWHRVHHALDGLRSRGLPRLHLDAWATADRATLPLETSRDILSWLEEAVRWRVLGWSATRLAERRWFGLTLFHPPSERLALQRAPAAARLGVEIQLLRATVRGPEGCACHAVVARLVGFLAHQGHGPAVPSVEELMREVDRAAGPPSHAVLRELPSGFFRGDHARHCTELLELLSRADALEEEAGRRGGDRGGWWGAVQYALGCFHAQVLALARETAVADAAHVPFRSALAEDYWAARAVGLLRRSGRDVKGPLGEDRRRWFEVDPDLDELRGHARFKDWKHTEQDVVRSRPRARQGAEHGVRPPAARPGTSTQPPLPPGN